MNEKFFFTRTVNYWDDGFSGEAGKFYDTTLYLVSGSLGPIGRNGYVDTSLEVMDDFPQ